MTLSRPRSLNRRPVAEPSSISTGTAWVWNLSFTRDRREFSTITAAAISSTRTGLRPRTRDAMKRSQRPGTMKMHANVPGVRDLLQVLVDRRYGVILEAHETVGEHRLITHLADALQT